MKLFTIMLATLSVVVFSCNRDDDNNPNTNNSSVKNFGKDTKSFVDYELNGESHSYKVGTRYFIEYGSEGSIGSSRSSYDFNATWLSMGDLVPFEITTGTLESASSQMSDKLFFNFYATGDYVYEQNDSIPWVAMHFVDDNGQYWYTDSADNKTSTFTVVDTVSYYDPGTYSATKKIHALFSCTVAQENGGPTMEVKNGEVVTEFQFY